MKDCRKYRGKYHFAKCCFSKEKVQLVEKLSDRTLLFVGTIELGEQLRDSEDEDSIKDRESASEDECDFQLLKIKAQGM